MPTAKPRITITLEHHAHQVLSRLSAVSGDSMSQIVTQYVALALPSLERVVVVLERARNAPNEARAGLASAIDRAERELLPALMEAHNQTDFFLGNLEAAHPPAPALAGASGAPKRKRPPASNTGVRSLQSQRKGGRRG